MRGSSVCGIVACVVQLALAEPRFASAQGLDPRPILSQLIQAFQVCGPPQAYQVLSPQLFQIISQQTQGTLCYQQIAAAGPVHYMQVVSQQQYPIGPLYVVRVHHAGVTADVVIGFNQYTWMVEYLTWQAAQGAPAPSPPAPPETDREPGGPTPQPPTPSTGDDGCARFPAMCQ